jgi:hypothetical protein
MATSPPTAGLQWPLDVNGKRASATAGKRIVAAALRTLDADATAALEAERHWRHAYAKHLRVLVDARHIAARLRRKQLTRPLTTPRLKARQSSAASRA